MEIINTWINIWKFIILIYLIQRIINFIYICKQNIEIFYIYFYKNISNIK